MFIYKITNKITNDFYIGKTTKDISKRFWQHKNNALKNKNSHLYNAIRKYGVDNFQIEIITTCQDSQSLNESEIYWIKKLNPKYNMTKGGDGGDTLSNHPNKKNIIEKISQKSKICNNYPERKILQSSIMKKVSLGITKEKRKQMYLNQSITKNSMEWKQNNKITQEMRNVYKQAQLKRYEDPTQRKISSNNSLKMWKDPNISLIMPVNNTVCCVGCKREIQIPNFHRWHKNRCIKFHP